MTRPLRLEFPGACYHVTARGDRQESIFENEGDYLAFIDLLAKEVLQQGWLLYAFCLMENHFHLLIETPEPNLVKGMRRLNGVYTQAFNRRHDRVGHVLQGRYKSIVVDKDSYLLELCRYVVLNPVRAKIVTSAERWPWSSYRATAGKMPCPDWLAAGEVLRLFGESDAKAMGSYARFVAAGLKERSPWEEVKGQIFLGSDAFYDEMRKRTIGKKPRGVARSQLEVARPTLTQIVRAVAAAHGIKPSAVLDRSSGKAFQRAVYLLRRRANLSLNEVAEVAEVTIGRVAQIQSAIEREPDAILQQLMAEL